MEGFTENEIGQLEAELNNTQSGTLQGHGSDVDDISSEGDDDSVHYDIHGNIIIKGGGDRSQAGHSSYVIQDSQQIKQHSGQPHPVVDRFSQIHTDDGSISHNADYQSSASFGAASADQLQYSGQFDPVQYGQMVQMQQYYAEQQAMMMAQQMMLQQQQQQQQNRNLCRKWPQCPYGESCRYFHPVPLSPNASQHFNMMSPLTLSQLQLVPPQALQLQQQQSLQSPISQTIPGDQPLFGANTAGSELQQQQALSPQQMYGMSPGLQQYHPPVSFGMYPPFNLPPTAYPPMRPFAKQRQYQSNSYRTQLCRNYPDCPYGDNCRYIHPTVPLTIPSAEEQQLLQQQQQQNQVQLEQQHLSGPLKDLPLEQQSEEVKSKVDGGDVTKQDQDEPLQSKSKQQQQQGGSAASQNSPQNQSSSDKDKQSKASSKKKSNR
ncbi:hypothetical protein MP228_002478 [Amoeboaphelidium protococcarum]|nr:hypothetical protein MP228_002478 [Amoeboaphelidium protococcarum]